MNFFLHKLMNHKRYLFIIFFTIIFAGFLFGLYEYQSCSNQIREFFQCLFVLKKEQNEYPIYLLQNTVIIFMNTYLSSSYIGFIGILFIIFLKGLQVSFSIMYVLTLSLKPLSILFVIIQLFFEILLLIISSFPNILLSLQTFIVTFLIEDNFDYKNILNYKLNSIICVLIIFIISLLIRVYLVDIL